MALYCKCTICGERFNREVIPFVETGKRRYAHRNCMSDSEDVENYESLERYIKQLFKLEVLPQRIAKDIISFKNEYNYSYSGMEKTLKWFYEIKKNPIEKANGGIKIIPFIYKEAEEYYRKIHFLTEYNEGKSLEQKKITVHIARPVPQKKRIKSVWED